MTEIHRPLDASRPHFRELVAIDERARTFEKSGVFDVVESLQKELITPTEYTRVDIDVVSARAQHLQKSLLQHEYFEKAEIILPAEDAMRGTRAGTVNLPRVSLYFIYGIQRDEGRSQRERFSVLRFMTLPREAINMEHITYKNGLPDLSTLGSVTLSKNEWDVVPHWDGKTQILYPREDKVISQAIPFSALPVARVAEQLMHR